MTIKVNEDLVNALASDFANAENQVVFTDLFKEIYPFIQFMAVRANKRASNLGVNIPNEDFESQFAQALYQSVKGYDPTLGNFMPRFQRFMKLRESDAWRLYERKSDEKDKDGRRYDKAQLDSLDREICGDSDKRFTLGETVLEPTMSAESEFFEKEDILKIISDFAELNERHAKVVLLLNSGASNSEIAFTFGETEYNSKIRKLVQRTKQSFSKFLSECESI
ncbi:hypothetical protein DFP94_103125 [Fontibacillus phaseoli]|uniref:Uncharacterized protein n=1 Tax=Fontibacillus phaseoli TaxID=1416533 RepID=A0A369BFS2_9BACL|nr:hypothetical protein [Fontibacillus phaseoli]RCX20400.1 hypothetical protein DFP94_103125 [Fontibacillus phaseoli]